MAKFCGNCGARMDENAKVCGRCGTPVESNPKLSSVKIIDPERKKKHKRIFILVIALILIAAIAAAAINVASMFTGYNGLLRKVMSAYEEYDLDILVSLSSDVYYYGDDNYVESYFENVVGTTLDSFESSVGHSYQLSYAVNETYIMSERNADVTLEEIENAYPDFDISIISEIVVSDVTVTAKQGSESVDKAINIIMSKEDGSWKLLYIN